MLVLFWNGAGAPTPINADIDVSAQPGEFDANARLVFRSSADISAQRAEFDSVAKLIFVGSADISAEPGEFSASGTVGEGPIIPPPAPAGASAKRLKWRPTPFQITEPEHRIHARFRIHAEAGESLSLSSVRQIAIYVAAESATLQSSGVLRFVASMQMDARMATTSTDSRIDNDPADILAILMLED